MVIIMKKLSSVLLCAVIIIPIMANLLTASSEPVSAHGWFCDQIFGAGSDFNITVNADGSYNLYTYQAGSFLTERAYDITKTDLSFKFTTSQANWYLLTVAAPTGDVGSTLAYEKTPTRVDFLIYGGKILCRQSTDDANGTVSQDFYGEIDFNDITHTFGIKQMDDGNWYPVIDGIVKTTISQKLNDFIDTNGTDLRLGIGVYNPEDPNNANKVLDIDIESVKTVPRIWEVKSDPSYVSDHALTTADGTSELILGSGHNSVFATIDSYDLTQKDIEFVLPNNVADSLFVIGLGTDFSNKGDLNYAIILRDGGSKSALMAGYAYNGWQDGAFYDSVFDIGASRNQTHTFGLRQKSDGYYYPAIDGKILELNISDPNAINLYNEAVSFVSSNKNALKFAIGDFGGPYIVKNVKIVDKNTNETLWTNVEPNNLTIHEDKPGVYSSKGTSRIYTTKKIDLASNDVFFKFDENVDYM